MLEGLEISVLSFKEVFESDFGRFDSEFYGKYFLAKNALLEGLNCKKICEISTVTDGEHGSPELDDYSGIAYLSGNNIKENYIDFDNVRYCSHKLHKKNLRSSVKKNSVLMSIVGTVGKASVVNTEVLANTDRNVATIKSISKDINPFYLSVFLNSNYGQFQTERFSTGNVQPLLNLLQVKSIVVPVLSDSYQLKIQSILENSELQRTKSKSVYAQAETILLDALNLTDFSPSPANTNTKSFQESFLSSGRLDAEYYQPKYDQLRAVLGSYSGGTTTIGSIAGQIANGAEVREYQEEGVAYLRVGDVKNLTIDAASVVRIDPASAEKGLEKIDLQAGDVLVSRSGSLAVTAVVEPEWADALISSHLIRLRITDKRIDPYYLALFLGVLPGKLQIQQQSNGGVQPEINQPALKSILVPIPPQDTQKEIKRLILEARKLREASNKLLEVAKRAVEIAIEQDETAALAFIEANL